MSHIGTSESDHQDVAPRLASPPSSSTPGPSAVAQGEAETERRADLSRHREPPIKLEQQLATPPTSQRGAVDLGVFDFGAGSKAVVFKDDAPECLSVVQIRWLLNQCTSEDMDDVLKELQDDYSRVEATRGSSVSPYAYLHESGFAHRKLKTLMRLYSPKRDDVVDLELSPTVDIKADDGEDE